MVRDCLEYFVDPEPGDEPTQNRTDKGGTTLIVDAGIKPGDDPKDGHEVHEVDGHVFDRVAKVGVAIQ